jgi:twinkle protein
MSESLPGLLAENNIRLKGLPEGGRSAKAICPQCSGGRTREISLSVTVDEDAQGAVWRCHRGKCGWVGSGRVDGSVSTNGMRAPAKAYRKPEPQNEDRPDWLYDWFAERKIDADTVDALGIYAHKGAIVFPYVWQGDVVNRKYRSLDKTRMWQEADPLPTLYNVDALGAAPDEVIFVEGEPDVAAMHSVGYVMTVSLKDGAPKEAKFESDGARFEALKTHSDVLEKPKRIILAGDTDEPGLALRDELARRLGRHRCRTVTWPAGCKDANETLIKQGAEAVRRAMEDSEPFPIEGIQASYAGQLVDLRNQPEIPTMGIGVKSADEKMKLPTEGRLCIITGWPGSGKSAWTRFLMVASIANHGRQWAVFSPEMTPWQEYLASCAEVIVGKPFWTEGPRERMSEKEAEFAEGWLAGRMTMIVSDALEEPPTLDWLLEKARICVLRDGTTDFLIDPWNELENANRGGATETDYIGRSLQRLKAFCARYGCNVWIVAHPAKPLPVKAGETRKPPQAYDISGSAHWHNKADLGLTIDSPKNGIADVICWKSRFRRWATRDTSVRMHYEVLTGRYSEPSLSQTQDWATEEL